MNVVVFCSDTFRYDHLGFLGQQQVLTPNLDRLARESANFSDFRLCSFPTVVNRIEVFTGRYTFPLIGWGALPFHFPVLGEVFQHHGFVTALVADNPHLMKKGFGFARGFDFVKKVPGQTDDDFRPDSEPMIELPCPAGKLEPRPRRLERYRRSAYWYRQQGTNPTESVCREAMRWLDEAPERFFLWIDAFDPHEPWDAPKSYLDQYPWNPQGDCVIWPRDGKADTYPAADLANMRSLYKAEVTQIDDWMGRLLEHMRQRKLLENTVVIFCSDHGYYLGEHGLVGKLFKRETGPNRIYEELGHLPLLVRHPTGLCAGKTLTGLCQPPDLFASALDFAEIPRVEWAQGNSLVPRLQGQPGKQKFAIGGCHPHARNASHLTVWTDEWCLIYSPMKGLDGSELFHLRTDPMQTRNVLASNRPVAEKHFAALESWLAALGVSAKRRRKMLHNVPFHWTDKMKQRLWMFRNRCSYLTRYRNYAGRPTPRTAA